MALLHPQTLEGQLSRLADFTPLCTRVQACNGMIIELRPFTIQQVTDYYLHHLSKHTCVLQTYPCDWPVQGKLLSN